ncbi:MAG TPA: hypothetical protein VG186_06760 [Solirubrobacteraceae bacterium]|nr:hypothetical protein [Solirubrobacteraceae bacterium]
MALGGAGTAQAAGTGSLTLTPGTVSSASGLAVSVTGLSGFSGLPSSVALLLQPGFMSSAKSVSVLCTAGQASSSTCPAASQIGTGSVGISFFGSPTSVPLTAYLGDPLQSGDIASVILSGSLAGTTVAVSGRLFVPAGGGLELLLSGFPNVPVSLDSLAISVQGTHTVTTTTTKTVTKYVWKGKGKHRKKHKVKKKVKKTVKTVYSVITNPSMCAGMWTGTATMNYSSGQNTVPLSATCTP